MIRVLGAVLFLLCVAVASLTTPAGLRAIAAGARMAGVEITGLSGHFPDDIAATSVRVADAKGVWLQIDGLRLDWSPTALIRRELRVAVLSAARVQIIRYPGGGEPAKTDAASTPTSLPSGRVTLVSLDVGRLELPDQVPLRITGSVAGTADALGLHVGVDGDGMQAIAEGVLDLGGDKTNLHVQASTRDFTPIDKLDWTRATLDARVTGKLTAPSANGTLHLEQLQGFGVKARAIDATLSGDMGAVALRANVTGLVLPGSQPDLFAADPVSIDAKATLGGPIRFDAQISTRKMSLGAKGSFDNGRIEADWQSAVPDLLAFQLSLAGAADLSGHIGARLQPMGGTLTAAGKLSGETLELAASVATQPDGAMQVDVGKLSWHGVGADAALNLAAGARLPTGQVHVRVDALQSVPGVPAQGAATADITLAQADGHDVTTLKVDATKLASGGASVARIALTGTLRDLLATPDVDMLLTAEGIRFGQYRENLRLTGKGTSGALALRLDATGTAALQASGALNAAGSMELASLQATVEGQTLRLLAPTRFTFTPTVSLDRTRLGLGGATLEVAGRVTPTLDITASLRQLPAALARLADPSIQAEGMIQADARITGTPQKPGGTLRVGATGLRMVGVNQVPPASIEATAQLEGNSARVNARLQAGAAQIVVAGTAPIGAGNYDLRITGAAELAMLDALIAGGGREARGRVVIDASLTGAEPKPSGTITLRGGSLRDSTLGARLADIDMLIRATPEQLVLDHLTARSGPGTLGITGTVGLTAPMPVSIRLTARNARPLASDALTTSIDADLAVAGSVQEGMAASGTVKLGRTDIRIPERLPSSLPSLNIRQPGPPPKPAPPSAPITLDIALEAPGQIFLRGRGLDAELAGRLHIGGSVASPKPEGGFTLRRGQFVLAGQTLNFTTGRVGFDGHLPIDPTINFTATSQGTNVLATLAITGTASAPRISLSSSPELPQDEVLAQLLFRRSASQLGPLQIAQIAAGLAQITDAGGAGGIDPLGAVRRKLGLDVLTVGGAPGKTSTLEAGRNLSDRVYIGAKQSTGGTGSQATVRIDITRGLRLEADLGIAPPNSATTAPGAAPTGNSVGLTYQFEY